MDKLEWFKFKPADYMMGKIQKCPEVTQARFLKLCCLYWNKQGSLAIDDAIIELDQEHFDILVAKKVVKVESNYVRIDFLDEQLSDIEDVRRQASEAGKASAAKRSTNRQQQVNGHSTTVQRPFNEIQQSRVRVEKIREEESREEKKIFPFLLNVLIDWQKDLDFQETYLRFIKEVHGYNWTEEKHISLLKKLKAYSKKIGMQSLDDAIVGGHKTPKPEWIKEEELPKLSFSNNRPN